MIYSDYKDVLYRDVSDGCRHRSEAAFCDIFPLCVKPPEGQFIKNLIYSFNLPFFFLSWTPQKDNCLDKFANSATALSLDFTFEYSTLLHPHTAKHYPSAVL